MRLNEKQYERLLSYTRQEGNCLVWIGSVDTRGYGRYLHKRVHRLYYEYHNGPIPDNAVLAHSCNNKVCLTHARPKTQAENMKEYSGKALQEECGNGHPLTEDNVYRPPSNPCFRKCRTCSREWHQKKYQASKQALPRYDMDADEE